MFRSPENLKKSGRWLLPLLLIAVLAVPASASLLPASANPAQGASAAMQVDNTLEWELVHEAPGIYWYTVDFPTADVGYAIGGPDWNVNNGRGQATLAKTTDGGKTWVNIPIPNTSYFMRGLTCKDADTCWVAGASSPRIQYTTDGGSSWRVAVLQYPYASWFWSAGYTGNGDTVMAGPTGYFDDEPNREANFMRSTDGVNFTNVIVDQAGLVQWDFSCPVPGTCYSASKERAYYTTNDGASWVRRSMPENLYERYFGIDCPTGNACWQVGANRRIVITNDTGLTWTAANVEYVEGSRPRFWDAYMVDSQHGYAVGCTSTPTDNSEICQGEGMLYRTDDGFNWSRIPFPSSADLMDVHAISMEDVVVVDWEGNIWRSIVEPTPTPTATETPTPTATPTATPSPTPSVGTVSGIAFEDRNDNLIYDPGEPGLEGARITLKQGADERYAVTTGQDGSFTIGNVAPGQYTLMESTPPEGYARNRNQVTFQVEANRDWTFYLPHKAPLLFMPVIVNGD